MLTERLNAARKIAEALTPSEADIDTAIASTSRLIGAIAEGRATTRLPISIGQESLAALTQTVASLVTARAGIAAAHAALAEDRISAGLRAFGMGDVSDCPPASGFHVVTEERSAA